MTPKQEKFVHEYLVDLNATQASIRAGYSEKTAYSIGCENLIKPEIQQAIQEEQKTSAERNKITIDEITTMHREAYQTAKEQKQAHAMTTTANNLAKLHGLIIDRSKIEADEPQPMTFNFTVAEPKGDVKVTRGIK